MLWERAKLHNVESNFNVVFLFIYLIKFLYIDICMLDVKYWALIISSVSHFLLRVGRQVVNIPSFMVRVDSQKHIDFSLTSPFGGGRPGRVKRKNQKAAAKKAAGGDGDEEDED